VLVHEVFNATRRLHRQLAPENVAKVLVGPERLVPVAFSLVGPHQREMGAFPQGLSGYCEEADVDRFREPPQGGETPAQRLQGVEAGLPDPLTLDQNPVVVPAR
jgi:hypothetical protein